ncbi:MAG: hypothetical protein ABIK61_00775 [candidate division WOR-3 bacterium]
MNKKLKFKSSEVQGSKVQGIIVQKFKSSKVQRVHIPLLVARSIFCQTPIVRFIIPLLVARSIFCQTPIVRFTNQPKLNITINTIYDDNIFQYSDEYLYDFQHQIRSYRFPFRSADDFIILLNPTLQIPLRKLNASLSASHLRLNYKQYHYTTNTEKSYQIFSLGINKALAKNISIENEYLYLPRYLIRYYQDPLSYQTKYIPCLFSEHLFSVEMVYKLSNIRLKPFIRYEVDNYERNFDFYDSKAIRYGMNVIPTIRKLSLEFSFEQKHNWAKGPVPDISYTESNISIGFNRKIPKFSQVKIGIDVDWSKRTYTTKNSYIQDPFHRNRTDTKYGWAVNLGYQITKKIQMMGKYENETRDVNSIYRIDIDDIKNYKNNRWSVGVKLMS